jgi:very-short-patch-repair endonuclease
MCRRGRPFSSSTLCQAFTLVRFGRIRVEERRKKSRMAQDKDRTGDIYMEKLESQEGDLFMRDRARSMRKEMTPAEKHLWQALRYDRCGGLRFRRQHRHGQYITDFYCATLGMVIEVDGEIHNLPTQKDRDDSRTLALEEERGLHIFRLSNEKVLSLSIEKLRQIILKFAKECE